MKRRKVKQIFQQLIIAVVVFSLICPGSLWAKRKGVKLFITKIDDQVIEGRLLRVRENSLILMTSGNGVTIDISEVNEIRIKRKSKTSIGLMVGFLAGGAAGYSIAHNVYTDGGDFDWGEEGLLRLGEMVFSVFGGMAGAVIGLLIGDLIGKAASKGYKTYQVKGELSSQIELILKKLKKKARFKD